MSAGRYYGLGPTRVTLPRGVRPNRPRASPYVSYLSRLFGRGERMQSPVGLRQYPIRKGDPTLLHTPRILMALLTVAVMVLALALTTNVAAAPTPVQPAPAVSVPADGGPSPKAEDANPELLQVRRGCWLVCWR